MSAVPAAHAVPASCSNSAGRGQLRDERMLQEHADGEANCVSPMIPEPMTATSTVSCALLLPAAATMHADLLLLE